MKSKDVVIGERYLARVSGRITVVEITGKGHPKGWRAKDFRSPLSDVYFKTGRRLWEPATEESMKIYLGFVPILDKPTYDELAEALVDVVDTNGTAGIRHFTGLDLTRCKEIIEIRDKVVDILE